MLSDKVPHTYKGRVIEIKSLHVMYYRPFDRSFGLRIINEVLIKAFGLLIVLSAVFAIIAVL